MKEIKKVSVVMGTYNGEKYLREQLDTILSQTYPIYEIIIQDDCSTDRTVDILKEYAEKYSIIKLFVNDKNLGFPLNYKKAFLKTTGEYIAYADQDDIWYPNKIEVLINSIGSELLAVSLSIKKDENKSVLTEIDRKWDLEKLIFGNRLYGHQMLFHSEVLKFTYEAHNQIAYDYLLALTGLFFNSIVYVDEPLQIWRRHENTATGHINYKLKKLNGKQKVAYTMKKLLLRKKSIKINEGFAKINQVLSILDKEQSTDKSKSLLKLTHLLSEQSFFGYIQASFIVNKYRKTIIAPNASLYTSLTYIYRWWYERQYDM